MAQAGELKVGAHMFVKASEIITEVEPVIKCLEKDEAIKNLDLKFSTTPMKKDRIVESLKNKESDLVRTQSVLYLSLAKEIGDYEPIAIEKKDEVLSQINFVTNKKSGIQTLADIKKFSGDERKTLLFASPVAPAYIAGTALLAKEGIFKKDFKKVDFAQQARSDTCVAAVAAGEYDLTAARKQEADQYKEKGAVSLESFPGFKFVWLAKKSLGTKTLDALRSSFIGMKEKSCFDPMTLGFVRADQGGLDETRKIMQEAKKFNQE